jgi:hypothetical protein
MESTVQGTCKLCKKQSKLKVSHFIPKFVGKWVKKTSVTGYIREGRSVHKRAQDIAKEHWLCGECEELFSGWERSFANKVFFPFVDKGKCVAEYESWMVKFCASVSWRTLGFITSKNDRSTKPKEYNEALDKAEKCLSAFLQGKTSELYQYEQHVFPLERIESTTEMGLPSNINRYFLRTMAMDIIGNSTDTYIYTKFPSFIILGFIRVKESELMKSSKIELGEGTIKPREYWWPDGFINYLVEKCETIAEAYDKIPEQHKKSFDEYIRNNTDKVSKSKLIEAFMYDYDQFGDDVFR